MLTPLYISENVPRAIRGLLTGLYQLFIVTGGAIAFWINYGAALHLNGDSAWVVPLAVQGLPAVLLFGCMLCCNESPRFLAKQDRWEQAHKILAKVRHLPMDHEYVLAEYGEMVTQLENERQLIGGAGFKDLMREMWTIPGNRKRALISISLMICQQMTGMLIQSKSIENPLIHRSGTNAINNYAPQIFKNLGITGATTGLFATGIYGVVKMVTCSIFLLFMADSLGRRRSLLLSSVGQCCCMFFIGLYIRIAPPLPDEPVPPVGYVALVCIFLFASFFQFGWGPVCWIYVGLSLSYAFWLFSSHGGLFIACSDCSQMWELPKGASFHISWHFLAQFPFTKPLRCVLTSYTGQRDPFSETQRTQCLHGRRNAMVVQFRRGKICAEHAGDGGRSWLRYLHDLRLFLCRHVRLCVVPDPRN
jgi:MFS family permease